MKMTLKYKGKTIISYAEKTWWITGFNPDSKYFNVKASDLQVTFTVCFRNGSLYESFKKSQF